MLPVGLLTGVFVWAPALSNTSVTQQCPHGPAFAFAGSGRSQATIYCDSGGKWLNLDVTQCQYKSDVTAELQQYSLVSAAFNCVVEC